MRRRFQLGARRKSAAFLVFSVLALPSVCAVSERPAPAAVAPTSLYATGMFENPPALLDTFGTEARHWRRAQVTIEIDASLERIGASSGEAVTRAFATWQGAEENLPRVAFVSSRGATGAVQLDGRNTVSYGRITVPGHERELAITLVYSDAASGNILEADVVINSEFNFDVLAHEADRCRPGVYDLQNVVTHEAGHFFGVDEDEDDTRSTMYLRTAACEIHKRFLTEVDSARIHALYASASLPSMLDEPGAAPASATPLARTRVSTLLGPAAPLRAER